MLTGNWLQIGKLNNITVTIGKKAIVLQSTLGQVERYLDLTKKRDDSSKAEPEEKLGDFRKVVADAADVLEVVLNPNPTEIQVSREEIMNSIDIDQMKLIIQVWVERKLYLPRLEADPTLAPEKGR
jgi:hypothetical protein